MPSDSGKRLEEALGWLVADDAQVRDLAPGRVEEDDAGRAEEREALEELAVDGARSGHVRLQQQDLPELGPHARVAQGEFLHLLTRNAPVGIEVEHDRTS